jgi:hypothetical protein
VSRARPPNIAAVTAIAEYRLRIGWRDHGEDDVDLSALVADSRSLAPLRSSEFFAAARVGEDGWTVAWNDDIELDADHLYRLARYQTGDSLTPEAFRAWRGRHRLSQRNAALALGISDRMVKYYEDGSHLVPKTVMLACAGYDALHPPGLAA